MTREEFIKVLQNEINENRNDFVKDLAARDDKTMTTAQMVSIAYNHAVEDAVVSLIAALEKTDVLKYED